MNIDYELLGKRIACYRKGKGLTQEKLAEKAEISNNYLSNIENNHSIPSLETILKLCIVLDITPNDLLLGIHPKSPHYMINEISDKLSLCTPQEKSLVNGFIELLLMERKRSARNID